MKTLRQVHLYLGCFFSPLLIYFSISGIWQVFRFNDVPKDRPAPIRAFLHALSNPHLEAALPGADRHVHSLLFQGMSVLMAGGIVLTAILGLALAFRFGRRPSWVYTCVALGVALPIAFLFISHS